MQSEKHRGIPVKGFFIDIGVPEGYERLQENPRILLDLAR